MGTLEFQTGKAYLGSGYASRTINHALSVVSEFYSFAVQAGLGPLANPVPTGMRDVDSRLSASAAACGPAAEGTAATTTRRTRRTAAADSYGPQLCEGSRTSGRGRKFVGGSGPGGGVVEVEAACGVEGGFGGAAHEAGGQV